MVLSRSAFGRRGAYLPSPLMFLMTLTVYFVFQPSFAKAFDNWMNSSARSRFRLMIS